MILNIITHTASLFLLAGLLVFLWRERKSFRSVIPIVAGLVLLVISRGIDFLVDVPSLSQLALPGHEFERFRATFPAFSDVADMIAVYLFILGFYYTMTFQRARERRIRNLEMLLPMCSSCKKYRTPDGKWQPIEQYLLEQGLGRATHGYCPDCGKAVLDEANRWRAERNQR